jgi:NTE family protein
MPAVATSATLHAVGQMKLNRYFNFANATIFSIVLSYLPVQAQTESSPPLSGSISGGAVITGAESKNQINVIRPVSAERPRPKIGLALGGGGTRGIAHLAVIRVLQKYGIPIDCIAGTSMGAIVGGLYCAGLCPDEIEKFFHDKTMVRSYETVPIPVRVALVPIFILPHMLFHAYDGMYRGNKFAKYINERVSPENRQIENLKIPFVAVCSNLLDGGPAVVSKGNLGRALQASSAIPGLRKPVIIGDTLLLDGGVVANVPVRQCRAMGADIVIAVDVDEELVRLPKKHFRKIGTALYRCLNMHLSTIDAPQIAEADIVIHPDVAGIELLSSAIKDMNLAVLEGDKAAEQAIPAIQEKINKKLAKVKAPSSEAGL